VVKQVTYTNTEQETNPLPVCNIAAVTQATQSECLVSSDVVKQVTYTNTEQETNPLPVCNIAAVTHSIDRWVLIGDRVESKRASFVANGYFLRVSPHPLSLSHPF